MAVTEASMGDIEHLVGEEMKKHRACGGGMFALVFPHTQSEVGNWDVDILPGTSTNLIQCEECGICISRAVQNLRSLYKLAHIS